MPTARMPAGMTAEITLRAQPTDAVVLPRSVVTLSDNGDLGIRAVDKDNKVVFFPIDLVDDTPTGLVLGGIPADARVIVAGQDLVKEGDEVKAGRGRPGDRSRSSSGEVGRHRERRRSHGYRQACDPQCAADPFGPGLPADRGLRSPISAVPKEAEPDVADSDHVCQPDLSGHLAGGRRAPAAAAGRSAAQEPQGAQGDEVGRLPGRRLSCIVEFDPSVDLATR